jgi:hypothetical protein
MLTRFAGFCLKVFLREKHPVQHQFIVNLFRIRGFSSKVSVRLIKIRALL